LALIHNGIIENHVALRKQLKQQGHHFSSETDTEVVVHMVEAYLKAGNDLPDAVRQAAGRIEGSFALVVVSADHPDRLVAARSGAPLILGLGDGETFVASDIVAVMEHTRRMAIVDDGVIVEMTSDDVKMQTLSGDPVAMVEREITWDREHAQKNGFPHFMLKEIHEQPKAIEETLRGRLNDKGELILDQSDLSPEELLAIDKVFIVACGSSYYAGLVAKYAIEHLTRLPVEIDVASEFRYRDPVLDRTTLVVGISQSGETADTLAAIRHAREQGARVVAITNVVGSSITRDADAVAYTHAGPEIGVTATKTLMTQMVVLWLLSARVARIRGTLTDAEAAAFLAPVIALPDKLRGMLGSLDAVEEIAERFRDAPTWLFIGRSVGYPVALEGALKLKEISYLHAEGFAAGEMKHGPIALIEEGVPVVCVATKSPVQAKLLSNVEEAKARGAHIIGLINEGDEAASMLSDSVISVPETDPLISPALDMLPLQLLAYYVATKRGLDPDKPRNLAKSVTVE
jgi:glucosamine--fructose-6-phosphate aminotransferase (isomerizing)